MHQVHIFECDHMRLVARYNGSWWHMDNNGRTISPCSAGVYKVMAEVTGTHNIGNFVQNETQICDVCGGSGATSRSVLHPTNPIMDEWVSSPCGKCRGSGVL